MLLQGAVKQKGEVFAKLQGKTCQSLVCSKQARVVILSDGTVVRKFFQAEFETEKRAAAWTGEANRAKFFFLGS